MKSKKIAGFAIIAITFVGIVIGSGLEIGWEKAAVAWGIAIAVSALLLLGIKWAVE